MNEEIKRGFIEDTPDERDYVFGAEQSPIILPSGNWREVKIIKEFQKKEGFDTFGCVSFAMLNGLEKLATVLFNGLWNKSDRFTYIDSGTVPGQGNSPRKVAKSIQKRGVIDESELPFNVDTIQEFNSPKPLPENLKRKAKKFVRDYEFRYDFLRKEKGEVTRETLREALKRGPVCIAVRAWVRDGDKYIRNGSDTHLTLLENVKDNDELEVFDSYEPIHKTLNADYKIFIAIRLSLREKTEEEKEKQGVFVRLLNWLKSL